MCRQLNKGISKDKFIRQLSVYYGNLFNRMNWYIMILKCILQNDETDCGPACLVAIFGKYGLKVSIAKIRDIGL